MRRSYDNVPAMIRDRVILLAVIALSLGLNLTAVSWGLPSRFAWATDELQPPIILLGIEERFSGDWHQPAYPPLHYYLLAASYIPLLAADAIDVESVEGRTLLYYLGRALSLAMGVGILLTLYRIGIEIFDRRSAVLASLAAALTVPFVYYAKFANLDVPLSFWVLLSLYFFVRHWKLGEQRDLWLFASVAVLAMCTKDQAYAFYVLPVGAYLFLRYRRTGKLVERGPMRAAAIAFILFLTIHNVVLNFWGFVHHFEEILWARSHYSAFQADGLSQLDLLFQTLRHIQFGLGWPLTLASIGGLWLAFVKRDGDPLPLWLVLAALSYYIFFIAPVRSTWLRYSLPLVLILSLFAGHALATLWSLSKGWYRAGIVAVLAYSFLYAASVNILLLNDSRYTVEHWLEEHMKPGEVVGFMGPEYYLPRFDGLNAKRLRPTESVLERSRPDYLVINPEYAARFAPGTREGKLFTKLSAGRAGYGLALQHQSQPRAMLLDFENILGNIAKANPVIEVYERAE